MVHVNFTVVDELAKKIVKTIVRNSSNEDGVLHGFHANEDEKIYVGAGIIGLTKENKLEYYVRVLGPAYTNEHEALIAKYVLDTLIPGIELFNKVEIERNNEKYQELNFSSKSLIDSFVTTMIRHLNK